LSTWQPSETGVANLALSNIEEGPLLSIDDATEKAQLVADRLRLERDALLQSHDWNFARRRKVLTPNAEPPEFDWSAAYALPADYIAFRKVSGLVDQNAWEVSGQDLLVNVTGPLRLVYTSNSLPVTAWDPLFVKAVGHAVAAGLAPQLTGSKRLRDANEKDLRVALSMAYRANAVAKPAKDMQDGPYVTTRRAHG